MNRVPSFVVVVLLVSGLTTDAFAQARIQARSDPPATELALYLGAWGLDQGDGGGLGGRLTVNRSEWFGTEVSLEGKKATAFGPAHGLLIVNARVLAGALAPAKYVVLTAGGAVGMGLRRTRAAMIGIGTQHVSRDGAVALRGDLQVFPGGALHRHSDRRLTISVAVLFP